MDKYIPITYENKKSPKEKFDRKKLPIVAGFGFNTQIGYITNISTAIYELQSKFDKTSKEWGELENRLKIFRKAQGMEIDRAKNGIALQAFPKFWTQRHKITEEDKATLSDKEIETIKFNNLLVVDEKRPYFMRYVYSTRNKEYRDFLSDFTRLSRVLFMCEIGEISDNAKETSQYLEFKEYYDRKNPLIETNGTMNRICRYMEGQVKELKESRKYKSDNKLFGILYNNSLKIELFDEKVHKIEKKYKNYIDFKKNRILSESEYSTYEQYFNVVKNSCLEEVSNNGKELANIAIYVCYKLYPMKPKDFVWNCFGEFVLENIIANKTNVWLPLKSASGEINYLGSNYDRKNLQFNQNVKNDEVEYVNDEIDLNFSDFDIEATSDIDFDTEF